MCPIPHRSAVCLLFVCLACAVADVSTARAQFQRQSILPTTAELSRLGLERAWWSQATLNSSLDKIVYLTADEDSVIAQSRTGIVTAFDSETGERLWARLLGTPDAPSFQVATNDDQVLLATGMNMFAIEKRTGRQLWQLNLPHHPSTAPGIDDIQAYIGTLDGSAYAFDLRIIRELYEDQRLPEWSNVAQAWRYASGAEVTSPPLSTGRSVLFANMAGSLFAVSQGDGSLTFQFETNGPIRTPLGRDKDSLFVASDDVRFFCINVENGSLRWTFVPGLPIRKQPRVVGDSVYVAPDRGGLYSLSTETGLINWNQVRASDFLAATDDRVYGLDGVGNVLILSREDGAVVSTLRLQAMKMHVSNDRTDRIFMATTTGVILSMKESGSEFPKYHKFPERQPILPLMGPAEEMAEDWSGPDATAGDEGAAPVAP